MVANNRHNDDERETDSAGQSGDDQGMSGPAESDSQSVEELVEEGNAFEASVVDGVENAKDPDISEVRHARCPKTTSRRNIGTTASASPKTAATSIAAALLRPPGAGLIESRWLATKHSTRVSCSAEFRSRLGK